MVVRLVSKVMVARVVFRQSTITVLPAAAAQAVAIAEP